LGLALSLNDAPLFHICILLKEIAQNLDLILLNLLPPLKYELKLLIRILIRVLTRVVFDAVLRDFDRVPHLLLQKAPKLLFVLKLIQIHFLELHPTIQFSLGPGRAGAGASFPVLG